MLSITTDYVKDTGSPEPYLERIAVAGFMHVHWCHHWHTDFIYSEYEIDQIARWMSVYGLKLNDLHGSRGVEKSWVSLREYERLAGVELVKNRIHMASRLASDVVVMHVRREPEAAEEKAVFWSQFQKSLGEIEPYARERGVRIALENLLDDNDATIEQVLARYSSDYIGVCYDSGHGNYIGGGLDFLARVKDRLISIHLHDNDGSGDQHRLLFSATVDWARLAQLIAESAYTKCVSMEVSIHNTGIKDERAFLQQAFETGTTFARMVKNAGSSG